MYSMSVQIELIAFIHIHFVPPKLAKVAFAKHGQSPSLHAGPPAPHRKAGSTMPGSPVDSDEDMMRLRTELAEQKKRMLEEKKRKKEEEAARIKAQNKAMRDKIKKTKAATDNNIADDVTADGKSVGQLRAEEAAASKARMEAEAARLAAENAAQRERIANTVAATDDDVLDDITADGKSVGQLRVEAAAASKARMEAEAARLAAENAAQRERIDKILGNAPKKAPEKGGKNAGASSDEPPTTDAFKTLRKVVKAAQIKEALERKEAQERERLEAIKEARIAAERAHIAKLEADRQLHAERRRTSPQLEMLVKCGLATLNRMSKSERGLSALINDVGELLREAQRLVEAEALFVEVRGRATNPDEP